MTSSNLARFRLILWSLVVVVGVAATLLFLFRPPERPIGLFGGGFSLHTTDGQAFTEADLVGAPSVIFFGYTFCPDVCPTTLAESTGWRNALGLSADDLRIIFVTVDPERDTPEALGSYLSSFGAPIIGLSGSLEETELAKQAFGIYAEKVDDPSSTEYLMDHTATVFMVGADGKFQGTIAYGEDTKVALEKIKKLIGTN